jgi:ABC-type polysaccharide/polyol phosphate export permease
MKEKLKRLFDYRELLFNLTRKEVKVKYKNSFLGFLWSLVTPLVMLVVFYVAFGIFLKVRAQGMTFYAFYLMAGILPWNFMQTSLLLSVGSVVSNAELVKKVYFPREVLPLSHLGSSSFHFLLQELMLVIFLLAFRVPLTPWIFLFPLIMLLELIFIAGLSMFLAALNVFYRDMQHFTEIAMMAWFWMTPIVYPISLVRDNLPSWAVHIYLLNPMTHIILLWQRIMYNSAQNGSMAAYFSLPALLATIALSLILLVLGYFTFGRLEGKFAEFI